MITLLLHLWLLTTAEAATCPQSFRSTESYVLTPQDFEKVKSVCGHGFLSMLRPTGIPVPAELMLYAAYYCSSTERDQAGARLTHSLSESMRNGPGSKEGEMWDQLKSARPSFEGVSPELKAQWKEKSVEALQRNISQLSEPNVNQAWRNHVLVSLKKAQPFLEEHELKDAIRALASSIAQGMERNLPGTPLPKLFQFAKESVRRELGLDYVPLTDLVAYRAGEFLRVEILAVNAPTASPARVFWDNGIVRSQVVSEPMPIPAAPGLPAKAGTVKWELNGRQYEAGYKAFLGKSLSEIAPQMPRLDHEALWSDGKLTGLVFPGANMGKGEGGAHEVMNEYADYFRSKGFKFASSRETANFRQFLSDEIRSGRLDYFFKEEHAQGQDQYFSYLVNKGQIRTGTKKLAKGKEEVVHIFYPDEQDMSFGRAKELSRTEVASWISERTDSGGKQLFYVDTACHGLGAACQLAGAAENKNLVFAGSDEQLDTFANTPASPAYHILDGVRGDKDFASMEKAMIRNNTENEEIYLLPHSAEWKRALNSKGAGALNMEIKLTENGKPVTVETVGR